MWSDEREKKTSAKVAWKRTEWSFILPWKLIICIKMSINKDVLLTDRVLCSVHSFHLLPICSNDEQARRRQSEWCAKEESSTVKSTMNDRFQGKWRCIFMVTRMKITGWIVIRISLIWRTVWQMAVFNRYISLSFVSYAAHETAMWSYHEFNNSQWMQTIPANSHHTQLP